jgi:hypothetical protein
MLPSELVRYGDLEPFGPVRYESVTTVPDPEQFCIRSHLQISLDNFPNRLKLHSHGIGTEVRYHYRYFLGELLNFF